MRKTIPALQKMKAAEKIACLTAYTYPMAQILDQHADLLLVGDSLGMVVYGEPSTLPVSVDQMIAHGRAVVKGSTKSLVVIDMPFGSYQQSPAQAFANAARIMQETGAQAIKLEGGVEMAETIAFLSQRGVPVMAHIGLTPQHVHQLGGYGTRGKQKDEADQIMQNAMAVEKAGAFAVVIEGTLAEIATTITQKLSIPTIGIGASDQCDGQILVVDDMLGIFQDFTPKFVKKYADLAGTIHNAVGEYVKEVKSGTFPAQTHMTTGKKLKQVI